MHEEDFWGLIERSKTAEDPARFLERELATRDTSDLVDFDRFVHWYAATADRRDLWLAAAIMLDGCSDVGFLSFRLWLIAQGEDVYDRCLRNPDSLVAVADAEADFDALLYVARRAYEQKTGRDDFEDLPAFADPEPTREMPAARPAVDVSWYTPMDRIDFDKARTAFPELVAWREARARATL